MNSNKKYPAPIVSLGKIIGYRIAGSGVFIKTMDMFKDAVYGKLVTKITQIENAKEQKPVSLEDNEVDQDDDFSEYFVDDSQEEDTNVNAAQGKDSASKPVTSKKSQKSKKESRRSRKSSFKREKFLVEYDSVMKKSKRKHKSFRSKDTDNSFGSTSHSLDSQSRYAMTSGTLHHSPNELGTDNKQQVTDTRQTTDNLTQHSIDSRGQETDTKCPRNKKRKHFKSRECDSVYETGNVAQTRKGRREEIIPRQQIKGMSMEANACSGTADPAGGEMNFGPCTSTECEHEVPIPKNVLKATSKCAVPDLSDKGDLRWADVVAGKTSTHHTGISDKISSSASQKHTIGSCEQEKNKNGKFSSELKPCSSMEVEENAYSGVEYISKLGQNKMIWGPWVNNADICSSTDEEDLDYFPPLENVKNKKNKKDELTQTRKIDGSKFAWKLVSRRKNKEKTLGLPIVTKSIAKEKKQRTKMSRKLAKLKRRKHRHAEEKNSKKSWVGSYGEKKSGPGDTEVNKYGNTKSSSPEKRLLYRTSNVDSKKQSNVRKSDERTSIYDSVFPDLLNRTERSYNPGSSWYFIDDMREVVIQPAGRVCPLREIDNHRPKKQPDIRESVPTRFTVVSVDTVPKPSSSRNAASGTSSSMNTSPIDSSTQMDVCNELSAMSVSCDDEPLSVSPTNRRNRGRKPDACGGKPSLNQRTRLQKEAAKVNAEEDSPATPKKTSARYRALLRRDLGKVDAKTATEMFNRGRWMGCHQKEKVYDRFESHQQRRNQNETDTHSTMTHTATGESGEGTSRGAYPNTPQYLLVASPTPDEQQTINVIDGVLRTLTVLNNDVDKVSK